MKTLLSLLLLCAVSSFGQVVFTNINIGTAPNDGTGDTLRSIAAKINAGFASISNNLSTNSVIDKLNVTNDTAIGLTVHSLLTASNILGNVRGVVNAKSPPFSAAADGTTDDRAAIQAAIDRAETLKLPVYIPSGTYAVSNSLTLPEGIEIFGDGMTNTILRQIGTTSASAGIFYANSGAAGTQLDGIYIHDLQMDGKSDTEGFSEHQHLLSLNGVKNARVERVMLRAFRGDGIYLGSGIVGGDERHNENVTIQSCVFDGVNYLNRNGLSVIDCDSLYVLENSFTRCSTNTMPGAIDVEPQDAFAVIRDIHIVGNRFEVCGGATAHIGIYLPHALTSMTTPAQGFYIRDNLLLGRSGTPNGIYVRMFETSAAALTTTNTLAHNVVIEGNIILTNTVQVLGVRGLQVKNNYFSGGTVNPLVLGGVASNAEGNILDATVEGNSIDNTGAALGGMTLANFQGTVARNTIQNIANAGSKYGIINYGSGVTTANEVEILDNRFRGGFTAHIYQTGNTTSSNTSRVFGNRTLDGSALLVTMTAERSLHLGSSSVATNNIRLHAVSGALEVRNENGDRAPIQASSLGLAGQLFLFGEGADVLSQYNGADPQKFYVYNTRTDGSNYERGGLVWTGNALRVGNEAAGTGTLRDVVVLGENVYLRGGGTNRWLVQSGGNLVAQGNHSISASAVSVNADPYGAGWSGSTNVPTKGDLHTKIEAISGVGSPGGSSGELQYNNSGSLDGASGITVGSETNLTVSGALTANTLEIGTITLTNELAVPSGGIGRTNITVGSLLAGNGTNQLDEVTIGSGLELQGSAGGARELVATGGGGSVFVNGSEVSDPNLTTNAAITLSVSATTNVVTDLNDVDITLTDAATIATDCSQGMNFTVTLGANRTLGAPSNGKGGRYYSWEVIQDATGNRTLSFATNFVFGTDITGITLSTNATYRDYIRAKCRTDNTNVFSVVGFVRGYP